MPLTVLTGDLLFTRGRSMIHDDLVRRGKKV
jgi:hypothetical protein